MQSSIILPKRSIRFALFAWIFGFALVANLIAKDATLRDVHIRGDSDFLEILLLLDSPFENRVVKEDSRGFSSIIFKNLNYTKNKLSTKSALIKNIEIFARGNDTYIVLGEADLDLRFEISVLNSPNALKITLKPKVGIAKEMLIKEIPNEISANQSADSSHFSADSSANQSLEDSISAIKAQNQLLTPSNSIESWRYALVVAILVGLIIALFIAKKHIQNKSPKSEIDFFKKPQIRIMQSINIDMKNKIIILDSKDCSYILFVGQNNAFLIDNIPKTRTDKHSQNLPQIITQKENKIANMLKAYKEAQKQNTKDKVSKVRESSDLPQAPESNNESSGESNSESIKGESQ